MIPSRWSDMELWALEYLRPLEPDVTIENLLDTPAPPYKHALVIAYPGPRITPITRTVRFDIEIRAIREAGTLDIAESYRIANNIGYHLENAPRDGDPIVFAEVDTGPNRVIDGTDARCVEMSVVAEIHRT